MWGRKEFLWRFLRLFADFNEICKKAINGLYFSIDSGQQFCVLCVCCSKSAAACLSIQILGVCAGVCVVVSPRATTHMMCVWNT